MSLFVDVVAAVVLRVVLAEAAVVEVFNIVQDIRLVLVVLMQLVLEQDREEQ
jgi:hypothetical protein